MPKMFQSLLVFYILRLTYIIKSIVYWKTSSVSFFYIASFLASEWTVRSDTKRREDMAVIEMWFKLNKNKK